MTSEEYSALLLRHEATSCKAEKELIVKSLRATRQMSLAVAINLLLEKKETAANYHYRHFRQSSKMLKEITGNDVYDRYKPEHWKSRNDE